MSYKKLATGLVTAGLLVSGAAQAALVDRGGGLIYDTTLNITWLADANYAKTQYTNSGGSQGDADGMMNWSQAMTWAANLSYVDSVRGVTYTDWRLPTVTDTGSSGCNWSYNGTDCGYNVDTSASEMAHLWHVDFQSKAYFNTRGGSPQPGWGMADDPLNANDESLFVNIQSYNYWSSTPYAPSSTNNAWYFYTPNGNQSYYGKSVQFYAWAVRDGDVITPVTVPEPATLALSLAGVLLAGLARRLGSRAS